MGSKNPTTTTNSSSTYTANPAVQSSAQGLVQSATSLSQNPYQAFTGQMVSGTTGQQQTGYGQVQNAAGIFAPFLQSATSSLNGIPQFNAATLQNYMSPYTSSVIQSTEAQLNNQDQQQQAQLTGNAISAGAFGGDRAAVAASTLAGQQDIANNATIANLENSGYQGAVSELNSQQGLGLQTASQYAGLGSTALTNALSAAGANIQAGTQQQQTQTAIDQANYQLYQNALAYPYQNLSFLSSILGQAGSTLGGTTTGTGTTTQTGVSNIGSILGGIGSILSLSDKRAKENIKGIGKLFDGTPVVKFNYKGDDQTQIGLLAQDVEKRHPEAVAKDNAGIRYVNYDAATKAAEKRKGFASGGIVLPYGGGGDGVIPLNIGSTGGGVNGQQMSEQMEQQMMNAGRSAAPAAQANPFAQISGVLQNKQSIQGIQNAMSFMNSAAFVGQSPDQQLALLGNGDETQGLFNSFAMSRGGFVPRQRFADGGSPYGDLSGLGLDSFNDPTNVFPLSVPADAMPVQSAPVAPQKLPVPSNIVVPPQSAPVSGIAAINGAIHQNPGDATFARMITQESGGHQFDADGNPLTSDKGAVGVAQIEPSTAPEAADAAGLPYDPERLANDKTYNLALGKAYYGKLLSKYGDPSIAAAAYNAGPGSVDNALALAQKNGGSYLDYLHPETQNYVANVSGASGVPGTALAFDGNSAPSTGLPVPPQSAPSGPLSGIASVFNGLMPHGTAPADSQHRMGGINPFDLPDDMRMALLAGSLGMMGSQAHFPGQQIGEGGLAGLQYLMQEHNLSRENAATASDIAYKQGSLALENRKEDIAERRANLLLQQAHDAAGVAGGGGSAMPYGAAATPGSQPSPTGALPLAPAATSTPLSNGATTVPVQGGPSPQGAPQSMSMGAPPRGVSMQPAASGFDWSRVTPESNPSFLDSRAANYEHAANMAWANPDMARIYAMAANRDRNTAQAIRQSGRVTLSDGSTAVMPGGSEAAATMAGATSSGEAQGKAPYQFQRVSQGPGMPDVFVSNADMAAGRYPGGPNDPSRAPSASVSAPIASQPEAFGKSQNQLVENDKTLGDQYISRQTSLQRLQTIGQIMRTYRPGAFAEEKADIARSLESVGVPVSDKALQSASNFQEFLKDATAQVFDQVKSMGGRILVSEISGLTKANVNPELEPNAAQHILAQTIGTSNWLNKYTDDYYKWRSANPYASEFTSGGPKGTSKQDFDQQWVKANPIQDYVTSARHELPYQGQPIPPDPKQREVGQLYEAPSGKIARWTPNGWAATQ